ncbi:MAG: DUF4293 domain-containing protein [Bacteroidales bacterium]|nr:DUF4293 domain-containing protein [Bacteroidales bacterium]
MIQRIQTFFLLVALLAEIMIFFFPIASFLSELHYFKLYIYELRNMVPSDTTVIFRSWIAWPILLVTVISMILIVVTILNSRKRLSQLKVNKINILLVVFLVAGIFFGYPELIGKEIQAEPVFGAGAWFPLIVLVSLVLANRFILKDERLVRSVDRLR